MGHGYFWQEWFNKFRKKRGISLTLPSAWSWTDLEVPEGPLYCPEEVLFVPIYHSQCTFLVGNTPAHKLPHNFNLFESETLTPTPGQDLYYVEVVLNCEEDL